MCKSVLGLETVQQFITSFQYGNYICLVFELLGASLQNLIIDNYYHGIPEELSTQLIFYSILSLRDLKQRKIIHSDIKPSNILTLSQPVTFKWKNQLLVLPQILNLKLCDFGNAFFEFEDKPEIVSTQAYRAPEVILGDNYSYQIDVFSMGCVYFELITGIKLFECKSLLCQILLMQKCIGIDSQYIIELYIKQSKNMQLNPILQQFNQLQNKFIYRKGQLCEQDEIKLQQAKPIKEILKQYNAKDQTIQLLYQMLNFNPNKRILVENIVNKQIFQNYSIHGSISETISSSTTYSQKDSYEGDIVIQNIL